MLTVGPSTNGTVNATNGWYKTGSNVTLTATANPTFYFVRWIGGGVPSGSETVNPLTLTMNQARDVTAVFATAEGALRVVFNPAGPTAPSAGRWRLTTGPDTGWHGNNEVISNLPCSASYTITFNTLTDWVSPVSISDFTPVVASTGTVTAIFRPGAMVQIPGGTYMMGIYYGEGGRSVTLSSFLMDVKEVTVGRYMEFCAATELSMPPAPSWGWSNTNLPIVNVTWHEAQAYAIWAGKRLPTEAEWEYAARGGLVDNLYPWGNSIAAANANYGNIITRPTTAASYPVNGYGLYDMGGNVYEWCYDWYASSLADGSVNPSGPPAGMYHVFRGGSWVSLSSRLRCAVRYFLTPAERHTDMGFRCASDASAVIVGYSGGTNSTGKDQPADSDGDGVPDWWKEMYFGGGSGGMEVNSALDVDGDGMTTADEYEAGTDPTDALSVFEITAAQSAPTGQGVTIQWKSVAGKVYDIQASSNLVESFVPIATGISATPPVNVYKDSNPGSVARYYRILVKSVK